MITVVRKELTPDSKTKSATLTIEDKNGNQCEYPELRSSLCKLDLNKGDVFPYNVTIKDNKFQLVY